MCFGVPSRKLLGFLVSERGIKENPKKIKAIERMCKAARLRDVQKFTGCLASVSQDLKPMLDPAPVLAAPTDKEPLLL